VKELATGLEVMATAPDGIVEAFYKPDQRFLWAVQWHPEFAYRTDENSRKLFSAFVGAMKRSQ
jgi:putative glutamine amidotransferase